MTNLQVYPNPAADQFHVRGLGDTSATVEVMTLLGQPVRYVLDYTSGPISVSDLKPGLYGIKISAETSVSTMRLLKQ